ncbi:unnamed protein product [Withania somnifera]
MAFAGTTQKCMACNKTVYLVDKLTADNRIYHKLGNYNSFEGVLYCRPHFDQLFKQTGSLDKSFEGTPKIVKPQKLIDSEVSVNGTPYHKNCFKCSHGGCVISPSNYIAHEGRLYCKHHHIQLIKEKGNLSKLEGDHEMSPAVTTEVTGEP